MLRIFCTVALLADASELDVCCVVVKKVAVVIALGFTSCSFALFTLANLVDKVIEVQIQNSQQFNIVQSKKGSFRYYFVSPT